MDRSYEWRRASKIVLLIGLVAIGLAAYANSFGGPVEEFLNFGIPGVIIVGIIKGYISALFYAYFLRYRNFVGFVLLSSEMGFSIFPIMHWPAYTVLWYVLNILVLLFHKQIISNAVANKLKFELVGRQTG